MNGIPIYPQNMTYFASIEDSCKTTLSMPAHLFSGTPLEICKTTCKEILGIIA
jgi:hypothetical protein